MSDASQKTSIELIDAIESILQHKSCPLSLDYLALKLQKKYTMRSSLTRPTFVTIVHNEIEKYPHRILPIENDMYVLAEPSRQERSTLILPEPPSGPDTGRTDPVQVPGCEEELEIHRLTQEVALLRELNAGCLAWNHSLAVLVKDRRRELEEINTDVNLLLASYHASKANGNKPKNPLHKKKYSSKHSKGRMSTPGSGKKFKKVLSERKHKLKTISIKKSKLKLSSKHLTIPTHPPVSSPSSQCSFPSEHNSQTYSSGPVLPESPPAPPSHPTDDTDPLLPSFEDRSPTSNFEQEHEQTSSSDTD